jgi:hypothetical protein
VNNLHHNPKTVLAKEIGRLGILVVCGLHALSGQVPSGEKVVLAGPEITKLDWNTRALVSHDIDGDGRLDLGLINNDSAKIELLYQTAPGEAAPAGGRAVRQNRWAPILEDAHFRRENIVTGAYLYGLAVGDLDNDGRPDLAYTSNREPLTVRFQDADGSWERAWSYDDMEPLQWAPTIIAQDVDGDGRDDLAVLAQGQLAIFSRSRVEL